jgi:hypothetical protein
MINLLLYSVPHSGNASLVLVVNPFITPQASCNLWAKRDLTINTADEVQHMVGGVVLVVVEDDEHVSCLKVSLIYYMLEKGHTTRSTGA